MCLYFDILFWWIHVRLCSRWCQPVCACGVHSVATVVDDMTSHGIFWCGCCCCFCFCATKWAACPSSSSGNIGSIMNVPNTIKCNQLNSKRFRYYCQWTGQSIYSICHFKSHWVEKANVFITAMSTMVKFKVLDVAHMRSPPHWHALTISTRCTIFSDQTHTSHDRHHECTVFKCKYKMLHPVQPFSIPWPHSSWRYDLRWPIDTTHNSYTIFKSLQRIAKGQRWSWSSHMIWRQSTRARWWSSGERKLQSQH